MAENACATFVELALDRRPALCEPHSMNLILNFTTLVPERVEKLPVIVRGEGCWVWDSRGRKYFDGVSSAFSMSLGHSHGAEIGTAMQEQLAELAFWPCWSASHTAANELAAALAEIAPPNLNHAYFAQSGSEANEAALKMTRQYHGSNGEPHRYKVLARRTAYHGMTQGALSLTGIAPVRAPFEPLMSGVRHLASTNTYRRPTGESEGQLTAALLAEAEAMIEQESPALVAAIVAEPVQMSGGCFVPPAGYFQGLRELCDRYGILLIADEVITAFGRLGEWFGSQRYGIEPDILTFAKAATAGHAPLGGMLVSDRVLAPLFDAGATFLHGSTFSGHPGSMAAALKAQEIIRRERVLENVRDREEPFAAALEALKRHPIVGDIRGSGLLRAIEVVKDQETKAHFSAAEREALLVDFLSPKLLERGLFCRAENDRGDPVVTLAPPLIAEEAELEWVVDVLDTVFTEAADRAAQL
jgi:adenosylmethionine-8-amino-7-oxononanoate aminotransferase